MVGLGPRVGSGNGYLDILGVVVGVGQAVEQLFDDLGIRLRLWVGLVHR